MGQNLKLITLTAEITRPSNTTAYASNKVVSDGTLTTLSVTNPSGSGGGVLTGGASYQVKSVALYANSSGTTNASFDVYLYSSGVTAFSDQANHTLSYNDKNVRIGKTSLTFYTGDTNSASAEAVNTDVDHVFKATGSNLYAIIVATAAYTPTSAEKFYLKVTLIDINS